MSVSHRIFFHPHEGRIGIRLGEAVARSHDAELFLVIFPARDELVQFLQRLLQHAFAPSAPMNEDEALFLPQTFQLLAHLLEGGASGDPCLVGWIWSVAVLPAR